jgi:hypothetical protein
MALHLSKEDGEDLLAIALDSQNYGYVTYPLFDFEAQEEQLNGTRLEAILFLLFLHNTPTLALLGQHATRDASIYLGLASGYSNIGPEEKLSIPPATLHKLKQTQIPLAILSFFGNDQGSVYPVLSIPGDIDPLPLLRLLGKKAKESSEKPGNSSLLN